MKLASGTVSDELLDDWVKAILVELKMTETVTAHVDEAIFVSHQGSRKGL